MQKFDLETIAVPSNNSESKFRFVPNGAYECYITKVTDHPSENYLEFEFEIAEGEFAGFATETMERAGFCPLRFTRGYDEKRRGYFKKFCNEIEASNKGYRWNWDEQTLVHKYIGLLIQEVEKVNAKGYTNVRAQVVSTLSIDDVKKGSFKVPERKTATPAVTFTEVSVPAGDLPF